MAKKTAPDELEMYERAPAQRPRSQAGWYERLGKRFLDLVLAGTGLIVLLPVFFVVAVLIRIFDRGPVIFRQQRVGRHGRPFRLLKFRSLPIGTGILPSDQLGAVRVTWIGRLLRRTNIDELPQLYCVLIGDMSVVGPRPSMVTQTDLIARRQASGVLEVRPGLTGLAQIRSYDGMSTAEKVAYDQKYISNITLAKDFHIIALTFGYLLRRPPVY